MKTRPDLGRELALLANNARMPNYARAELQRLTKAVDARLLQLENALRQLQVAVGDETYRGGERVKKRDGHRLSAAELNGAIVEAKAALA